MKKLIQTTLLAWLSMAAMTSWAAHHKNHAEIGLNIVETAAATGTFETLIAAAKAAGLVEALSGEGPLTVFAPTDDAFGVLPAGTIESLLKPENKDQLASILKYHVVVGEIGSTALADGASLDTLAGPTLVFQQTEQGFSVQGARLVATDIAASNGVVHVIDRVMLPPERMSRRDVLMSIDAAIARGAPLFNDGQPDRTMAIYADAARLLLSSNSSLSGAERARLRAGLQTSHASPDASQGAWQLRYALDDVSRSMMTSATMSRH